MDQPARELNRKLTGTIAGSLLSEQGRRLYFPRGIVAQAVEAQGEACRLNATAGIAALKGRPLFLSPVKEQLPFLEPEEIFSYAPTAGLSELRERWLREMMDKNPSLAGKETSRPVIVGGLTHGLSLIADLFVDAGDTVVMPEPFWGNYNLIFSVRRRAHIKTFYLFDCRGGLDLDSLERALGRAGRGKVILLLNFPNNPTGYSVRREEADRLHELLAKAAAGGLRLLLVLDDAYFGLFYEQGSYTQSIFARAADLHENILAVKVDGATKENLAWGLRLGFVTFASSSLGQEHYAALEQKLMGALRSSVSSSSRLSQSLLLRAMKSPDYLGQKRQVFDLLKQRYLRSRELLASLQGPLDVLPFNSGYFLCFRTGPDEAEPLRRVLLSEHGIGTISLRDCYLRVAYSSVDEEELEELYCRIMQAAAGLRR
jgi:aspartate/methionine/tyrosine aminotransferase